MCSDDPSRMILHDNISAHARSAELLTVLGIESKNNFDVSQIVYTYGHLELLFCTLCIAIRQMTCALMILELPFLCKHQIKQFV